MRADMALINNKIKEIQKYYEDIWALHHVSSLARWDLQTYMPPKGGPARGIALAKTSALIQRLHCDKKFVKLIHETENEKNLTDQEKGVVRVLKKDMAHFQKYPPDFVEEIELTINQAYLVWVKAKKDSDYSIFAPELEKMVKIVLKASDYLGYEQHPYDALINHFEEGLTSEYLDNFFAGFRNELKQLLIQIMEKRENFTENTLKSLIYDKNSLQEIYIKILEYLNYDPQKIRVDTSPHPFTFPLSNGDLRITTNWNWNKDFGFCVRALLHEFGHALYELQIDEDLQYTPIGVGKSPSVHESQSRFWENMVGRSRAFSERFTPLFRKLSPEIAKYIDKEGSKAVYRYMTQVQPGLIRVEADEVTYNFHIMIRYEIEKALLGGEIKVKDLPSIWNEKMNNYLNIVPQKDSDGILQDIHWSSGIWGMFSAYSLGTFLSAMWKEALEKEIGDVESLLKDDGAIVIIQKWLREKVHRFGSTYTFKDLVPKALNQNFSTQPFLDYLKKKYL